MSNNSKRGTGRTTGKILEALGRCISSPQSAIRFKDHNPQTTSLVLEEMVHYRIEELRLSGITVTSNMDQSVTLYYNPKERNG